MHSRRAFITGNVEKPGMYPLNVPMTVLQLIATAGGLREFVAGRNIVILARQGSMTCAFRSTTRRCERTRSAAEHRAEAR
jgi:protein involved in polysaccharide export with SLBB domain